ncbi:MAG: tetratricopeptide repeat protein [Saprospiraceae bacterium]|nr:tetratricopeptide repeat protein [Saprospiraceae bacterium]
MKDLLKKYQNNELNTSDTEGVEKRLIEQAVEREMRQKWAKMLESEGVERSTAPTLTATDTDNPVLMTAKRTQQRRLIVGIAASLLLVVGFWWWDVQSTTAIDLANKALFNEHFAAPSVRMGTNDDAKSWADAKNAYRDGQFEQAATLIEAIPTPSVEQQFYLALSLMYAAKPNYEKASALFKSIIDQRSGNFETESQWFYALCCIKLGKNEAAKQSLEAILRGGQKWKMQEAREFLKKL